MNGSIRVDKRAILVFLAIFGVLTSVAFAGPGILTNGVPVTGLSGTINSEVFYVISVPSGQDELEISISGGTGDCDLYVRRGSEPTTTSYDYRPYKIGNNETVTVTSPVAGMWYVMLHGYSAYSGVTLTATYSGTSAIVDLKNGFPVTGLAGPTGSEKYFSIEVPSGQSELLIAIFGGTGDCDLYVKRGKLPTTSDYDYRPFLLGNDETVDVKNPTAGTWYIMLRADNTYTDVTLVASYSAGAGIALQNGVPMTDLSGALDSETLYRIEVPADMKHLVIMMSNGVGDCDLYVKYGSEPTTSDWDYRPFLAGKDEVVSITNPAAGTWYIMLHGATAYFDVTLKASYDDVLELEDEVPVPDLAGAVNSEMFFKIDVPSGQSGLEISIAAGIGNADLYVRYGAKPSVSSWDYRPHLPGNKEVVTISKPQSGTWYIMLRARQPYSGVTLLADYWFDGSVTLLTNGVPETDISDAEDGQKYFRIIVPSGRDTLEIAMSGGTGDADLYVKLDSVPTTKEYDYRPYEIGNNETVTIEDPPSGNWLIMIHGYEAYEGVILVATHSIDDGDGDVIALTNGVPVANLSGVSGSEVFYKIDVPAGQQTLTIQTAGGTGDADLYVRKDALPTTTEWDYRPYKTGNNETVTIDNPAAGTYFIMLRAYVAYTGVTLQATYLPIPDPVTTLTNSVPVPGLSGAAGSEQFFKIEVPAGQDFLNIEISGGIGDCDLYVRKGSKPTTSDWDYRPFLKGNDELVEIISPAPATWYIMLYGGQAYAGVTLVASYGVVSGSGNIFTGDENCVALWRFEDGELQADSVGTNDLSNNGAKADQDDPREGDTSAHFRSSESDWMSIDDGDLSADFPTKSGDSNVDMSICFWVKPNSVSWENSIISKYLIATDDRSWRIYMSNVGLSTGILKVALGTGSGGDFNNYVFDGQDQILHVDHWYHVAFTYTDSDKGFHIRVWDGTDNVLVFDATGTAVWPMAVTDAPVVLGQLPLEGRYFNGWLDEVVIFNDVLTTDEIDQIRQQNYGHAKP
ncbi:MAG: pre-peptidase C-terminal domain-containing protein [Phycisphaerales bacterium]|nr:MAG: pre-peptidase C-terminal domain-containing protein [Phycisphaerales bacterium]